MRTFLSALSHGRNDEDALRVLQAKPNPLVIWWFDAWSRRAMREAFHRVHLYADGPSPDPNRATLYLANHSSFWDGILLNYLIRHGWKQRPYCMIDAAQVRKHPFFRRIGGFSVDRSDPRDGLRAITYAAELLTSGASVVLFPQGKIEHNDKRPLAFESGVLRVLDRAPDVRVVTVAMRYEFWTDQRAETLVSIAAAPDLSAAPPRTRLSVLEQSLTTQLDSLKQIALQQLPGQILFQGKSSISQRKHFFSRP